MNINTTTVSVCCYSFFMFIVIFDLGLQSGNFLHFNGDGNLALTRLKPEEQTSHFRHRKLMSHGGGGGGGGGKCSKWDISISQSRYPTAGIPEFIVQIVNTCVSVRGKNGCAPSNIHVRCGWFASTRIVNPKTFKRLSFDDCLVNGGRPLKNTQTIRFTYSNSFMYPLQFKSATFC